MPYEDEYKNWLEKSFIKMNPDWICDGMADKEFTHEWCDKHCGEDSVYITPKCLHMYYHHIARAEQTEPQIYGNEYNCIMTMFGDCSYAETGCGSCKVVEKVRKALEKYEPKDEPQTDCAWK